MNPTSTPKPQQNKRETGARKYPASRQQAAATDTHAGMPTANPFGLTQPLDETSEAMRQSDGVNQPKQPTPTRQRQAS